MMNKSQSFLKSQDESPRRKGPRVRVKPLVLGPKPTKSGPVSPLFNTPKSPLQGPNSEGKTPKSPGIKTELTRDLHQLAAISGPVLRKKHTRSSTRISTEVLPHLYHHAQSLSQVKLPPHVLENAVTRCAYKTRTGDICGRPKKQNQDTFIVAPTLKHLRGQYLFGVCDGHGENGHEVAGLIKDQLSKAISESYIRTGNIDMNEEELSSVVRTGFQHVEKSLSKSRINFTYSGSTCVSVLLNGRSLLCANVGDSRAILLSHDSRSHWFTSELSTDHKPDLPKEFSRIVNQGGRVAPFRSPQGTCLGPARVWLKNEDVPGLAMSRSIGDQVAHTAGVSSEPEILCRRLTKDDKILVLASDGLWEFLTNQEVAKIAESHWAKGDLEGCCDHLVEEALRRWREEDEVTDDITVLVVFLVLAE